MSSALEEPLNQLAGLDLSEKHLGFLETLGCRTLGELLMHLPRRYEDRKQFESFPNQPMDQAVCVCGEIIGARPRFGGRRRFFEITVESAEPGPFDGPLVCRWFQMPWLQRHLAVGQRLVLYGKPKRSGQRLAMDHPEFEIIDEESEEESVHMGRITPVYPLTSGLPQRVLREVIHRAWREVDATMVPDVVPREDEALPRWKAIRDVHFPETLAQAEAARRALALEEFIQLQVNILARRAHYQKRQGASHCGPGVLLNSFLERLGFTPTDAQTRAVDEIRSDLKAVRPMNRLLQGDVGSGKTLVAISAMLLAVEAGFQAALMAPTQILAEQHYQLIRDWLEPLGVRVGLRTASRVEDGFLPLMAGGEEPQILVGTHALLYDRVPTGDRLGLVIIDEQHKFGVRQRGQLTDRAVLPDILVMTATPIPRTLSMTVYGDLDVSVLDEMPRGRGKIITAVRSAEKTPQAAVFLKEQIEKGRQVYIVYPLIEESEKLALADATRAFEEWKERLGPEIGVGLLHGRLAPEEKEAVMERFRARAIQVLVSTTVIEVGVDVPNATVMMVYHAERFGLAQLHQLRGRIGRGTHKSYCVLMHASGNTEAAEKLGILAETQDGFRIAEADLARRGPGDLLGTAQSGLPALRLGEYLTDVELVREARERARAILQFDPALDREEHAALRVGVLESAESLANIS